SSTVDTKGRATLLPDLYLRYADCSFVTKNYSKAVEAYGRIVEAKGASAEYAQFQKGVILGLQGKNEEKIVAMNYLLNHFPSSKYADQAYYEIGETNLESGNNTAARNAYQNVITKYPNSSLLAR